MIVAVGFFDGVHLGHQAILKGASAALTFRNHPLSVLAPDRAPRLIMTCAERVAAIRSCGVGEVMLLEFTRELAEMPPESFASRYFSTPGSRGPSVVRCGENWRFGAGGAGDAAFLLRRGVRVEVVPYAEHKGEPISSSRIRAALERGELEDANAMMGRAYRIGGKVVRGKGLGRRIGYPTVNLQVPALGLCLPHGVYEVEFGGGRGIANYGLAPTMGARAWPSPVLELHALGERTAVTVGASDAVEVSFLRFIRPERKFDSVAALQRQIAADCASCAVGRPAAGVVERPSGAGDVAFVV